MRAINATSRPDDLASSQSAALSAAGAAVPPADASSEWVETRDGADRWQVRADWLARLEGNDRPDWGSLEHDPRATRIKAHATRQVWRVDWGTPGAFVKVYRAANWRQRLRWRISGTPGARECRVARYALAHGIRTVVPLALGEADTDSGRRCVLLTAAEPGARPLQEFWPTLAPESGTARRDKDRVIDQVARLIARAHQSGFQHLDLHAGNVLIGFGGQGMPEAIFVDLHNVRTGQPVHDKAVLRDLARFNQWFSLQNCTTDRLRFLNRYLHWRSVFETQCRHGRRLGLDERKLHEALGRTIRRHADALYAKRDRRGMRPGRYFTRLTLGNDWTAHVFLACKHPVSGSRASRMTFTAEQWRRWLAEPADLIRQEDRTRVLKESLSTMVCRQRLETTDGQAIEVVCKRFTPRNVWRRLQGLFRVSRPMRNWKRANAMLNRGIPTARPLAVLEQRRFGLLRDSIIIVEYIDHANDLDALLTLTLRLMPDARQREIKRRLTLAVVDVIRRIRDRGLVHRDLKAPNIIVQWDPDGDRPPRVVLVDLDGVKERRGDDLQSVVIRMIARLDVSLDQCRRVSLTDRLRFLKHCLDRTGGDPTRWKPVWQDVARRSAGKRELRARFHARVFDS